MPMKKFIGKPYAGKPHVRFDEGAGKVLASSRSTLLVKSYSFLPQRIKKLLTTKSHEGTQREMQKLLFFWFDFSSFMRLRCATRRAYI
jgi:hypothetical protein